MAQYKVTAVVWEGHEQGSIVTDPSNSQADLDVLVKIGVLELVSTPPTKAQPQKVEEPDNGDLSQ